MSTLQKLIHSVCLYKLIKNSRPIQGREVNLLPRYHPDTCQRQALFRVRPDFQVYTRARDNGGRDRLPYLRIGSLSGHGSGGIFHSTACPGSHPPGFAVSLVRVYSSPLSPIRKPNLIDYAISDVMGQCLIISTMRFHLLNGKCTLYVTSILSQ